MERRTVKPFGYNGIFYMNFFSRESRKSAEE